MLDYTKVPVSYMTGAVQHYIDRGIQPGDFLTAVICNDLTRAVHHADRQNRKHLAEWVGFFYWEVPAVAWGSRANMEAWIEARQGGDGSDNGLARGER